MDIAMVRGDTLQLYISSIKTVDGSDYVLRDTDIIYLDVKRTAADKTAAISKSVTAEKYVDDKLPIVILPEDTADLVCGDYVYDVRLYMDSDNIYTIIPMSKFKIVRNITDIPNGG